MGKIAIALNRALARRCADGTPGALLDRPLACGAGWTVEDVICTSGPEDRSYEETHTCVRIALVVEGTFQYRSTTGYELLTPGSLLLGNERQCFECGHDHGRGDRCVSFGYAPEYFERLAADGRRPRGVAAVARRSHTSHGPIASCSQYVTASTCQRMKRRPPS